MKTKEQVLEYFIKENYGSFIYNHLFNITKNLNVIFNDKIFINYYNNNFTSDIDIKLNVEYGKYNFDIYIENQKIYCKKQNKN